MRGDYMLSAVTRAVSGCFKGKPAVANETLMQNAPGEFLFVQQLNNEQTPDNKRFHNRFYFFDVRFHPDNREKTNNRRVAEITERLMECLCEIQTDDQPVRASRIRAEVQDGVLHCFADYPVRVIEEAVQLPQMQGLAHNENLK